jgi:hypothetical protein
MNPFFSAGHIALWLLFAGLFFPRLALAFAWLSTSYPSNNVPDLLNLVLWLFIPRFLMAFYIYTDQGSNNIWFWAYIVTGVVGAFGETRFADRRIFRRKRVIRQTTANGDKVTTIVEEEV